MGRQRPRHGRDRARPLLGRRRRPRSPCDRGDPSRSLSSPAAARHRGQPCAPAVDRAPVPHQGAARHVRPARPLPAAAGAHIAAAGTGRGQAAPHLAGRLGSGTRLGLRPAARPDHPYGTHPGRGIGRTGLTDRRHQNGHPLARVAVSSSVRGSRPRMLRRSAWCDAPTARRPGPATSHRTRPAWIPLRGAPCRQRSRRRPDRG